MSGPCFLVKCIAGVKKNYICAGIKMFFLINFLDSCDSFCL